MLCCFQVKYFLLPSYITYSFYCRSTPTPFLCIFYYSQSLSQVLFTLYVSSLSRLDFDMCFLDGIQTLYPFDWRRYPTNTSHFDRDPNLCNCLANQLTAGVVHIYYTLYKLMYVWCFVQNIHITSKNLKIIKFHQSIFQTKSLFVNYL